MRIQGALREERFTFLLTAEERDAIDRAAVESGLDRSAFIRLVLFGRMPPIKVEQKTAIEAPSDGS